MISDQILWRPATPSTAFLNGVHFSHKPQRVFEVQFEHEADSDSYSELTTRLRFVRIEKVTILYGDQIPVDRISVCYDTLIGRSLSDGMKEFEIMFDDGPYISARALDWELCVG